MMINDPAGIEWLYTGLTTDDEQEIVGLSKSDYETARAALESDTRRAERAEAEAEALRARLDAAQEAAHMPDDWPHGLPSWIAQRLYAAYIGAAFSPDVMEQIRAGRLTFPEAPIYAEAAQLRAELDAARAAQEWRPVTEPPTDNGDYLVWVKYPKEPGFHSVARWTQRFKWENNFVHPTYWQPLPAAPGDGDEEVK